VPGGPCSGGRTHDGPARSRRDTAGDRTVAREVTPDWVLAHPAGTLLLIDARFRPADGPLVFGDQKEMGLGVRLATPLAPAAGGRWVDAEKRVNEKGIRGKTARGVTAGPRWAVGSSGGRS
jgi:hypothetical protein